MDLFTQQTSSPEVSLVNRSAAQASAKAQTTAAISGRKCYELYGKYSPLTWLVKTLAASTQWTMGVYSSKYALTWKMQVTPFNRFVFLLAPRVRRTAGTGGGLLAPTPRANKIDRKVGEGFSNTLAEAVDLLPTPKKSNTTGPGIHGTGGMDLQTYIALLPTPAARDRKGENIAEHCSDGSHMNQLPNLIAHGQQDGLRLQPGFVEWMMGYPLGWTDIEPTG